MLIQPRDYQIAAIEAVDRAYKEGITRPLIALPTGTGKTIIFASLIKQRQGRALVIAHRDELIRQAADKIAMVNPDLEIGIVKAGENDTSHQCVVASIQTLSRQSRLQQMSDDFNTIVIDEAHHAAAGTYRSVLEYFGAFEEPSNPDGSFFGEQIPLVVGVTATPDRGDEIGLDCVFQKIVFERDILQMIKQGYLCDLVAKRVEIGIDFSKIKSKFGDYKEKDLTEEMMRVDAPQKVVRAYLDHGEERKAIVFAPSVEIAHIIADLLNENSIAAAAVDCNLSTEIRRETLRNFTDGKLRVVCNYGILTEGYDEPSVTCIIVARPTKIRALYAQMIGRGTRLYPGKQNCLIMDVCGVADKHKLITLSSLFGKNSVDALEKGKTVQEWMEEEEKKANEDPRIPLKVQDIKSRTYGVDLFGRSQFNWLENGKGGWTLAINRTVLGLQPYFNGTWRVMERSPDGHVSLLAHSLTFEYAQGFAEDRAREMIQSELDSRNIYLLDPNAAWRQGPASPKQIEKMTQWNIKFNPNITKGEASDLMSKKIAKWSGL